MLETETKAKYFAAANFRLKVIFTLCGFAIPLLLILLNLLLLRLLPYTPYTRLLLVIGSIGLTLLILWRMLVYRDKVEQQQIDSIKAEYFQQYEK